MRTSVAVRWVAACATGATPSVVLAAIIVARTAPAVEVMWAMVVLQRGGGCAADRTTGPLSPPGTPGSAFRHLADHRTVRRVLVAHGSRCTLARTDRVRAQPACRLPIRAQGAAR